MRMYRHSSERRCQPLSSKTCGEIDDDKYKTGGEQTAIAMARRLYTHARQPVSVSCKHLDGLSCTLCGGRSGGLTDVGVPHVSSIGAMS